MLHPDLDHTDDPRPLADREVLESFLDHMTAAAAEYLGMNDTGAFSLLIVAAPVVDLRDVMPDDIAEAMPEDMLPLALPGLICSRSSFQYHHHEATLLAEGFAQAMNADPDKEPRYIGTGAEIRAQQEKVRAN